LVSVEVFSPLLPPRDRVGRGRCRSPVLRDLEWPELLVRSRMGPVRRRLHRTPAHSGNRDPRGPAIVVSAFRRRTLRRATAHRRAAPARNASLTARAIGACGNRR